MERNTLMAQCYPKLKDYCREKHGLEFQVKKCRWPVEGTGVVRPRTRRRPNTPPADNDAVQNFCKFLGRGYAMGRSWRSYRRSHDDWALYERNQKLSATFDGSKFCGTWIITLFEFFLNPFKVFLGQKYGYRPIPTYILSSELQLLRDELASVGTDVSLLDTWYRKDSNAVPPISVLQPISSILVNFNNKVWKFNFKWEQIKLTVFDRGYLNFSNTIKQFGGIL